jgi:hypothetical protein
LEVLTLSQQGESLAQVRRFKGAELLLDEQLRALPQPDQLCGPFWARIAVAVLTGRSRLPDLSAFAATADTAVWPHDLPETRPAGQRPRTDAWTGVRRAPAPSAAGTSAQGVGHAIETHSEGAVRAVPATGLWTAARLRSLLEGLHTLTAVPIANPRTGALWGATPTAGQLDHYLSTGDHGHGPAPDWHVGHFAALWGTLTGPRGTLAACADTYRSLGTDGRHLQPVERLAAALARDRPHTGGVLLAVPSAEQDAAHALVIRTGLEAAWWEN